MDSVVKTTDWDYKKSLNNIKPKYVVHGDDWKFNNQKQVRQNVIKQIRLGKELWLKFPIQKEYHPQQ